MRARKDGKERFGSLNFAARLTGLAWLTRVSEKKIQNLVTFHLEAEFKNNYMAIYFVLFCHW